MNEPLGGTLADDVLSLPKDSVDARPWGAGQRLASLGLIQLATLTATAVLVAVSSRLIPDIAEPPIWLVLGCLALIKYDRGGGGSRSVAGGRSR